ncbi:hypothetical protein FA13DRAFT_1711623 [Coprinellus micaceus]|uniref:DUF6533 domain-containing protein n=1 Tax=Coprinellus micaceus TaxID=71717 RepID=A0A4Y7T346_COPMI|nr:hypothetical protein FA13DRAFT_1711623 [Coprinellus micaceus]
MLSIIEAFIPDTENKNTWMFKVGWLGRPMCGVVARALTTLRSGSMIRNISQRDFQVGGTPSGVLLEWLGDMICINVNWGIVASYCLYVYYVLTTTAEEVSIIFPQRWSRGKLLYATIRYRTLLQIALQFSILQGASYHIHRNAFLTWLEQLSVTWLIWRVIGIPFANALFNLVAQFQYPPEPVSLINVELGYPCYVLSEEGWEKTMLNAGRNVHAYVNLVSTASLSCPSFAIPSTIDTFESWAKVIRVVSAIIWTPAVIPMPELDPNPVYLANYVLIPILAQRLLVNMRKVDYMGSEPVASKLLFALPAPGSEDDLGNDFDSLEMTQEPSGLHQPGSAGGAKRREVGVRSSSV